MKVDIDDVSSLPNRCGVYLMHAIDGAVLYVGKAKNLRNRIKQYFRKNGDSRLYVNYLVPKICNIEIVETENEKQALILEGELIKKLNPKYNILLKDDKSYPRLSISIEKQWPGIEIVRRQIRNGEITFGPYMTTEEAMTILRLACKRFLIRRCKDNVFNTQKRPCLLFQLNLCLAPCIPMCSKRTYNSAVKKTVEFIKQISQKI